MIPIRKLISSNDKHFIYVILRNKYINIENLTIDILPKITHTIITNYQTKRHIITFGWLLFDITIDFCYNLNK